MENISWDAFSTVYRDAHFETGLARAQTEFEGSLKEAVLFVQDKGLIHRTIGTEGRLLRTADIEYLIASLD